MVVGLDDAGFVDDSGESAVIRVVDDGDADADKLLNDFKAGVEVGVLGEDMVGFLDEVAGGKGRVMFFLF